MIDFDQSTPEITIRLIGTNGKHTAYRIGQVFSFWKRYELEIDSSAKEKLADQLDAIEFQIEVAKKGEKGAFYLDNLSFA